MGNEKILDIATRHLNEEKLFLIKEKNTHPTAQKYLEEQISEINSQKEKNKNEYNKELRKEKIFGYTGDIFTIFCILIVVLSLFLFGAGVYTVKNGFVQESQSITKIEPKDEQPKASCDNNFIFLPKMY